MSSTASSTSSPHKAGISLQSATTINQSMAGDRQIFGIFSILKRTIRKPPSSLSIRTIAQHRSFSMLQAPSSKKIPSSATKNSGQHGRAGSRSLFLRQKTRSRKQILFPALFRSSSKKMVDHFPTLPSCTVQMPNPAHSKNLFSNTTFPTTSSAASNSISEKR